MKKLVLFLTIVFGSFFFQNLQVEAAPTKFYEAEYIPDVYVVREKDGVKYYQQGRVYRNIETNEVAYCLQPFALFDLNATYESMDKLASLDDRTTQKLKEIVAFSYPLGGDSLAYYMAVQLRIWQIVEPDCEFYFTDGLNGPPTAEYDFWFNIINDNLRVYNTAPNYANKTFTTTVHGEISVDIPYSGTYESNLETNLPYTKEGDTFKFQNLKQGDYEVEVVRKFHAMTRQPQLFYYHNSSQLLMNRGFTEDQVYSFKIQVVTTSIHIKKVDSDTKSKQASGSAKLEGAVFGLYKDNVKIATIPFDQTLEATISESKGNVSSLPFGTYILKEEKAGEGYLLNSKAFEITLDEAHPHIELVLENQVIKNEITLQKLFEDNQLFMQEAHVEFEIYDAEGDLYKIVETGEDGTVNFELPYGTYRIHQKTGKEGYEKVEDFEIFVTKDQEKQNYILYDKKTPQIEIQVPNTNIKDANTKTKDIIYFPYFSLFLGAIYAKKKMGL